MKTSPALAEMIRRIPMSGVTESRGTLTAIEFDDLPFVPRRVFLVSDVPVGTIRGGHAHRTAVQFLLCVAGELDIRLRNGDDEQTLTLSPGDDGVLISPGVWSSQTYRTADSTLLVVVSEPYTAASYLT